MNMGILQCSLELKVWYLIVVLISLKALLVWEIFSVTEFSEVEAFSPKSNTD